MARKKNPHANNGQFAGIPILLIKHPVWGALDPAAVTVLLGICARYKGYRNGEIAFSCREAADFANISKNTAARAFRRLQDLGIIKCVTESNFDCRKKLAREWALTYQPVNNKPPTNEWKNYKS